MYREELGTSYTPRCKKYGNAIYTQSKNLCSDLSQSSYIATNENVS